MLVCLASGVQDDTKKIAVVRLEQVIEASLRERSNVEATSFGWGIENDFPSRDSAEGKKSAVLAAFIGWSSVDANTKCRNSELFSKVEKSIEDIVGSSKLVMLYLECKSLGRGTA